MAVTLVVNLPLPYVMGELVQALFGNGFEYRILAPNATWVAASGLPPGVASDPSSGVISGSPSEMGDFPVSVLVSNRYGAGSGSLTIRVSPVAAWGYNSLDQATVPAGLSNVVAVAGGQYHSLALRADGTVAAWGKYWNGTYIPMPVPAGLSNVAVIAAGKFHCLALRANGTVAAWPSSIYGQTTVPAGLSNVVAVAGGEYHSLALRADGTVVAWGNNNYGQTNVPAGLSNVVAVAAASIAQLWRCGPMAPRPCGATAAGLCPPT